jgi:NADH dehydrogenase
LQPVYVGDVAEAAARVLATPETQGNTYELGGPRTYPYKELLRLVLAETGRKRLLIPVPYAVWDILALLMSPLPRAPISSDQVTLMKRDNVVAADALTLEDLGIAPTSIEAILPDYRR